MWNFKGTLWNSTQNILPIHWKMWILFTTENLRALIFKSSKVLLKRPPGNTQRGPTMLFRTAKLRFCSKLPLPGMHGQLWCTKTRCVMVNLAVAYLLQIVSVNNPLQVKPSQTAIFRTQPGKWARLCVFTLHGCVQTCTAVLRVTRDS